MHHVNNELVKSLLSSLAEVAKQAEEQQKLSSVEQVDVPIIGETVLDRWLARVEQALQAHNRKWQRHVWEDREEWRTVANLLMDAVFMQPEYDPNVVRNHIPKFLDAYRYLMRIVDQNLPNFMHTVLISENQYKRLFRTIPSLAAGKQEHFLKKYFEAMQVIDPKLRNKTYKQIWFVSNVYYPAKLAPVLVTVLLPDFTYYADFYVIGVYLVLAKLFASKFRQHVRYVDKSLWPKALELVSPSSKLKQYGFDLVRMFKTIAQQIVYSWLLRKIAEGDIRALKDIHIELYNKATAPARTLIAAYYKVWEHYKKGTLDSILKTGDKAGEEDKEKEFTFADIPSTIQQQAQEGLQNFALELQPDPDVIEYVWIRYINKDLGKDTVEKIAQFLHEHALEFKPELEVILATIIAKSGVTVLAIQYQDQLVKTAFDILHSKNIQTRPMLRALDKIYKAVLEYLGMSNVSKQTETLIKRFIVAYLIVWILHHM